jgi:hypothetical protein
MFGGHSLCHFKRFALSTATLTANSSLAIPAVFDTIADAEYPVTAADTREPAAIAASRPPTLTAASAGAIYPDFVTFKHRGS